MPTQSTLPFDSAADKALALAPLRSLPVREGHWDELRAPDGALREPWRQFFALLGKAGAAGLDGAAASVARQVRENDITYNVYADRGGPRPWSLDLLPLLIDEDEWALIERGVAQRARLLNEIVADIYGPQTLLARGLLPGALVFGHPGYLRAVKGYTPPDRQYLQIVALDLARAPDGQWTVVSHRTEAPSGLGYLLENRLIVSSLFAEPFRAMRVHRLAPSYSQLIATLADAARAIMRADEHSARGGSPHIVLLTPGPFSETYFEHVFLARYLGLTLVEGKDLTVRDDMLYLKTLGGLERVHAVLRRLDDTFCDPVELRADSTIGVPGLLQVMRAGNVMVSNVPGAGFVESPALHGFMPGIAQALLGEPLVLPGVPTWWCGEDAAWRDALTQLPEALLVPTWPGGAHARDSKRATPPGLAAGPQLLADWRARIEQLPDAFTVQQPLNYSYTPRYDNAADQDRADASGGAPMLGARPAVLRVYAIADQTCGWRVLPGGFTRLAAEHQESVSMQVGGSSVDTWVLSSQPGTAFSLLPTPMKPSDLRREHRRVSSRAAENLFWAGRYGERAENAVRLCRLILGSLEGSDAEELFGTFTELAAASGLVTGAGATTPANTEEPLAGRRRGLDGFERELVANLHESARAPSIGQMLASQAYACGEIRGRLSSDHWRTVLAARNDFRDALQALSLAPAPARQGVLLEFRQPTPYDRMALIRALDALATQLSAISGCQGDRMTRDEAWRLLFAGRHIERVAAMAGVLRIAAHERTLATPAGFDVLLQLFDSTLTYRTLYPGRLEVPALLDLIVTDPTNPRGLYGVYDRLRTRLDEIAQAAGGPRREPFAAQLAPVDALPDLEAICDPGEDGRYPALTALCDALAARMAAASNEISARWFSHAMPLAAQVWS
ncbi:circularly permuted type 2 ATP-grasp protein [Paraburkholderia tropica]|uniref:circularly permuted type 2 ATP-grasp protein n=1 Tax=Paraburkholderia tropica TaxID=92647 RepID=UPI0016113C6D|nr:circularly permuted type 2 ATP-grasp protein [Paraburkholderia tropica]MBB2980510.1 putative circularly permuted ATP-grasp superfamily protein/putative alpha-E superfamily protein [Paraburkholderia tropica]